MQTAGATRPVVRLYPGALDRVFIWRTSASTLVLYPPAEPDDAVVNARIAGELLTEAERGAVLGAYALADGDELAALTQAAPCSSCFVPTALRPPQPWPDCSCSTLVSA